MALGTPRGGSHNSIIPFAGIETSCSTSAASNSFIACHNSIIPFAGIETFDALGHVVIRVVAGHNSIIPFAGIETRVLSRRSLRPAQRVTIQ